MSSACDRVGDQRAMPFAADPIEDDAGDAHGRIVRGKAAHQCRSRLRLAARHRAPARPAIQNARRGRRWRHAGRCAPASARHRTDPMTPSITTMSAPSRGLPGERVEQFSRHRPAVEIDARRAGDGRMESRIDVIRPGFGGAHNEPAPPQRRQQRQRHGGLAGAGMRRGDDEAARGHLRCRPAQRWRYTGMTHGAAGTAIAPRMDHRHLRHGGGEGGVCRSGHRRISRSRRGDVAARRAAKLCAGADATGSEMRRRPA